MILINGVEVVFERFPNNETRLDESSLHIPVGMVKDIEFKYEDDSDLIRLMFLKKYSDSMKVDIRKLIVYYLPYSRMDRSENNSPFTLKYIADFINELNFESVTIVEPHSDVSPALINNSTSLYINYDLLSKVKEEVNFNEELDYIVFPDNGSSKRYSKMTEKNVLIGHKNRDFKTGQITSLEIIGGYTGGRKAIIVDDLSSFGNTFVKTAIELSKQGIDEVYLLVAHAENSIFKGDLFKHITKVFTTDSILTEQNHWDNKKFKNQLHIFELKDVLHGGKL